MEINEGRNNQRYSGVMDADTESRFVQPGNYRYLLNGENGVNEGNFGAIEDTLGNIKVSNPFLRAGTNRCVGAFEDVKNGSVIFAVYNSGGYHGWYRWFAYRAPYVNGVVEKIYQVADPSAYDKFNPNPLNFQEDHLITGISLVGNDLYWTDGYNQPKCMDIVRANETNKPRKFDVLFNSDSFGKNTAYTLDLYDERSGNSPVFSMSWTPTSGRTDTYADRVDEFIAALSGTGYAQYFYVEDNDEYATITMNMAGRYYFDLQDDGDSISYVSPNNFYPDVIPGITNGYAALSDFHTNSIKAPPDIQSVKYGFDPDLLPAYAFKVQIAPFTTTPGLNWVIGFDNDSTDGFFDTNNIVTLGAWSNTTVNASFATSGLGNFLLQFRMRVRILSASAATLTGTLNINLIGLPLYTVPLADYQIGDELVLEFSRMHYSASITPISNPASLALRGLNGANFTSIEIIEGEVAAVSTGNSPRNESVVSSSWQFRSRYNYRNNKQSTWSACSIVPKPLSYEENSIRIDYNDVVNDSVEKFSELTSVDLAYTNDAGATWFKFKTINNWEFAGVKEKYYYFNYKESPIAISSAESALTYHNIPVTAQSQDYAGNRVWYGGLKDAYYADVFKANFGIGYKNKSNPTIYPSLDIYNETIANYQYDDMPDYYKYRYTGEKRYGCFWKSGWRGYIGIVYYDEYNRNYPVMLCEDSLIQTKFPNQNALGSSVTDGYVPEITWQIYSLPPKYATKYRFARTKNFLQGTYLNFYTDSVSYVDANDAPVAKTAPTCMYAKISLTAIANFNVQTGGNLSFTFSEGDIYRPSHSLVGPSFSWLPYREFIIRKVITDYVYIDNDPLYPELFAHAYEVSTVNTAASDSIFYEFGDYYPIIESEQNGILMKTHGGETQDQSVGTSPLNTITPAEGTFAYGDGNAWYSFIIGNAFVQSEHFNPYEEFTNENDGRPQVFIDPVTKSFNVEDELILRESTVRFTDPIVENTQINGLSAVQPLNEKQYDSTYGMVEKLQVVNDDVLKVIFGNSRQLSIYVGQSRLQQSQGQDPLIVDADSVLGESHLVQRTLGTVNPESVVVNDEGDMMGYDETEGVAFRASGNGLIQISDYLQKTTFKNFGNSRMKLNRRKSKCPAVYDLYRDLYILTLNNLTDDPQVLPAATAVLFDADSGTPITNVEIKVTPNNQVIYNGVIRGLELNQLLYDAIVAFGSGFTAVLNSDGTVTVTAPNVTGYYQSTLTITLSYKSGFTDKDVSYIFPFLGGQEAGVDPSFTGVTLAFSKQKNGWTSYYSFVPEYYGRLKNDVVSFKDGELWVHNRGTIYKNFYGTQYTRRLRLVSNDRYPKVKAFKALWVTGEGQNSAELFVMPYQGMVNGMHSLLNKANFSTQQGVQMAALLRDDTTPGFRSAPEARLNGRPLVGQVLEVELTNDDATNSLIYSVDVVYNYSEKS